MRADEVRLPHLLERSGYEPAAANEVKVELEEEHRNLKVLDLQIDFEVLVGMEEA